MGRGECRSWAGSLPVLLAVAGLAAAVAAPTAVAAKPKLVPQNLPLSSAKLYDVSVADVEGDGDYDLFSTNHKYRGSLLLGDGAGGFGDGLDGSRLSATAHVPGFDDLFDEPWPRDAGLYLWVDRGATTHLRTLDLGTRIEVPAPRVSGEIRFSGRVADEISVQRSRDVQLAFRTDRSTRPATTIVSFDAGPNARLALQARFMDLPFEVAVEPTFRRSRIMLGPRLSHPPASRVGFDLGDRHGTAWADFDQDGITDAYIANGGSRGAVRRFGENFASDELYWGTGNGRFSEGIARTGIEKGHCRGRQAAPVDYNGDGQLDIFVGCEGIHPLLLRQQVPGRFGSRSHELGKARVRGSAYRWLDLDGDRIPELITVRRRIIKVYRPGKDGKPFVLQQSLRAPGGGRLVEGLSFADLDGDLDPDLFVGSRGGNSLLINRGGRLKLRRPSRLGLPAAGTVAASFVDYDNDGRTDLHTVPQGLFRQRGNGRFAATGAAVERGRQGTPFATASWLDVDGDGDRDLASTVKRGGSRPRSRLYENRTRGGHWLQLDLRGALGNIEAIGARVTVTAATRGRRRPAQRQTQWVGQAEGSRYSSGHYRTYFGLGKARKARRILVRWPDGTKTKLKDVRADRLLTISQQG